jgi:hypothetical protein
LRNLHSLLIFSLARFFIAVATQKNKLVGAGVEPDFKDDIPELCFCQNPLSMQAAYVPSASTFRLL